jgi:hypothetical protein
MVEVQDVLQDSENGGLARIWPNPVSGALNITLKVNQPIQGQLFTADGRLLHTNTFSRESNILDVSNLPSGMYFLKLWNDHTSETQHFIKI